MLWSIRLLSMATVCLHVSGFTAFAGEGRANLDGYRFRHHMRQAIAPVSVNIIDPMTRVSRLPSGRIFIPDPYHARQPYGRFYRGRENVARSSHPYAPPAFYIIGEPSRKSMDKPVSLNHGIKPHHSLITQPNVVFLVQKPEHKSFSVKN